MEHRALGARGIKVGSLCLGIDEIVPPGRTVNPADDGYQAQAVAVPALRRRPRPPR